MSVAEACARWCDVSLNGRESAEELADKVRSAGIDIGSASAWDDVFYTAFVERIDRGLAELDRPLFLVDWPMPLAALARRRADTPWAERFEAYVGGVELANAFAELTDAAEQRRRFEEEQATRRARGFEVYPIDEAFMAALEEGMPESSGIALGVDRLAMLVAGAEHIRQVSAFVGDEL
jgi:lysyl-tRNA synthetase class 2